MPSVPGDRVHLKQSACTAAAVAQPQGAASAWAGDKAQPEQSACTASALAQPQGAASAWAGDQAQPEQSACTASAVAQPQGAASAWAGDQAQPEQSACTASAVAQPRGRPQPGQETRHSLSRVHAQMPFSSNHGSGWVAIELPDWFLGEFCPARRSVGGVGPHCILNRGKAYHTCGLHILFLVHVLQSLTHPVHPPELVADLCRCTGQCQHIASY